MSGRCEERTVEASLCCSLGVRQIRADGLFAARRLTDAVSKTSSGLLPAASVFCERRTRALCTGTGEFALEIETRCYASAIVAVVDAGARTIVIAVGSLLETVLFADLVVCYVQIGEGKRTGSFSTDTERSEAVVFASARTLAFGYQSVRSCASDERATFTRRSGCNASAVLIAGIHWVARSCDVSDSGFERDTVPVVRAPIESFVEHAVRDADALRTTECFASPAPFDVYTTDSLTERPSHVQSR